MGISNEGTFFPESTGAVEPPPVEVEHTQPADQTPTEAVENTGEPVTTKFGPSGTKNPTGFVTLPESESYRVAGFKVVNPPDRQTAKGSTTAETTNTGSTRTQRAAHAADDATDDGGR